MNLKDFSEPVQLFRERLRNAERMAAHGTDRQLYFHLRGLLIEFDRLVLEELSPRIKPMPAPLPPPVPTPEKQRQFSDDTIRSIRRERKGGMSVAKLAAKYACSVPTIYSIVRRETYKDVVEEIATA